MEHKKQPIEVLTRRKFVTSVAAAVGGMTVSSACAQRSAKPSSFLELLRAPDAVTAYGSFEKTLPAGRIALQPSGLEFRGAGVVVQCALQSEALSLTLAAPSTPIAAVHVRWRSQTP